MQITSRVIAAATLLLTNIPLVASIQFNVTAIGAKNGHSTLECWQLDTPVSISTAPGTAGSAVAFLGGTANASYTVLPPNFDGGIHNAPLNQ